MNKHENTMKNNFTYLLAGGAIGAGLALLFAPKSGRETREDISYAATKGLEKTKEISTNFTEKAKDVYQQVQEKAAQTYSTAKDGIDSTLQAAKQTVSGATEEIKSLPEKAENLAVTGLKQISETADHQTKKMKA